jgi:CRP/FNR family cyclic AMP-dependent transcriptional regulator
MELLEGLTPAESAEVFACARPRTYRRGEVLFHEGDPGDSMHLIAHGHFALRFRTPAGTMTTLRIFGPGAACGHAKAPSVSTERVATVVALERGETLELRRGDLERLLARFPAMLDAGAAIMAREFDRVASHLHEVLHVDADLRVRRRLLSLIGDYRDGDGRVRITASQEDLAGLAGTSRRTVNRVLAEEQAQGTIACRRGAVEVLDAGALARRAR